MYISSSYLIVVLVLSPIESPPAAEPGTARRGATTAALGPGAVRRGARGWPCMARGEGKGGDPEKGKVEGGRCYPREIVQI